MSKPLRTALRVQPQPVDGARGHGLDIEPHNGGHRVRLYDVKTIATIIRVLAEDPPEVCDMASTRLYGHDRNSETVRQFWHQQRTDLGPTLRDRGVMAVLGNRQLVQIVLTRSAGRRGRQHPI